MPDDDGGALPPGGSPWGGEACEDQGECRRCFEGVEDRYKIIFTRQKEEGEDRLEDPLF